MNKLLYLFVLLLLTGCDAIFGTREPEDPNDDVSRSLWQQPTSPGIVLLNLKNAFLERNEENYLRSLVDSTSSGRVYLYIPDQEAAVNNPGTFAGWGLNEERVYINLLFSETSLPEGALASLEFTRFEEPSIPSDSALFEEVYELELEHTLENVPTKMMGIAKFRMARSSDGSWSIYRWEDLTFSSDDDTLDLPTWSELKARVQ